jgi:hypothetical protein
VRVIRVLPVGWAVRWSLLEHASGSRAARTSGSARRTIMRRTECPIGDGLANTDRQLCTRRINATNEGAQRVVLLVQHSEAVTDDALRPCVDWINRGPRRWDDPDLDVESRRKAKPPFTKYTERLGTYQTHISERHMPRIVV